MSKTRITPIHQLHSVNRDTFMNLNITQHNLHLLLPSKITTLAQFYAEDHGCTMFEAIRHIYASPLYERLADESTKLWQLGATTLYEELD